MERIRELRSTKGERYVDPGDRYVAGFASPWRRAAAAAIDWGLCYMLFLLVSIPLGIVQNLGRVSWEAGDFGGEPGHVLFVAAQWLTLTPILGYWIVLLPTSQTYGMRVMDLRVVATSTGRGISRLRAVVRSVVASLIAIAFYVVFMDVTAFDKGEQLDATSMRVLDASYVLAAVGCVSALAMFASPARRSLVDRVFGTATLDELEAVAPRMGPWGPLDAFDTSR
jgi:uncharacterized RDD family membrane protein YckC